MEEWLQKTARPLVDSRSLDPLIEQIGERRVVMLGEASHGTHEYYTWRAALTRRLVREREFSFVAVEGDWPDCRRLDGYVKGQTGESARAVLEGWERWPRWMWANWETVALGEWLRAFNDAEGRGVGFYGLDVYSLFDSIEAVRRHLAQAHPDRVEAAEAAFACFSPYERDTTQYAYATALGLGECEDELIEMLRALREGRAGGHEDPEEHFDAEMNAASALGAERYYRTMMRGDAESWNLRDTHMADTLDRLLQHHGDGAKAVVWEHNTHVGDARHTDMAREGMTNLGQLGRERYGEEDVFLVGFGSYAGSVVAGERWGAPWERMAVPPAREESWEQILHHALGRNALLLSSDLQGRAEAMESRGHRAIGVVYDPSRERWGNYVPTVLPRRYDAFLYLEESRALHPLHGEAGSTEQVPETYPFGE